MNRHEAYRLLARTISEYRDLPGRDLSEFVGTRASKRIPGSAGAEFLVDVTVVRVVEPVPGIRVHVTVDSPNTFRLERVEDEILIPDQVR